MATIRERRIKQSELSSECWLVQFWGLSACETCEVRDTDECGGVEIRKSGQNEKGYDIPLGEEVTQK